MIEKQVLRQAIPDSHLALIDQLQLEYERSLIVASIEKGGKLGFKFLVYQKNYPKLKAIENFAQIQNVELCEPFCWLAQDLKNTHSRRVLFAYLEHISAVHLQTLNIETSINYQPSTNFEDACRTTSLNKCAKLLEKLGSRAKDLLPLEFEPARDVNLYAINDHVDVNGTKYACIQVALYSVSRTAG